VLSGAARRRAITLIAICALLSTLLPFGSAHGVAPAPTLTSERWTNLTGSAAPSPRYAQGMAYDGTSHGVILFGGRANGLYPMNDTWRFQNGTWTNITPAGSPAARQNMCMVWDPSAQVVLLFGGDEDRGPANDTWEYAHGKWTELPVRVAPPPADGPSCTYDPSLSGVLLFGGQNGSWSNETWVFSKGSWAQLHPLHSPPATIEGGMTFDAADHYVLLFGGFSYPATCGCITSAAWIYSKGDWRASTAAGPSARAMPGMIFDASLGRVILYGGYGHSNFGYGGLGYWTWSYLNGSWANVHLAPSPPWAYGPGFVFDPAASRALAFGGVGTASQPISDTWALS
jgi:hypothetical protein